jgi:hypothetical protein
MIVTLIISCTLLLIGLIYLIIVHYILALEMSEYEKTLPNDFELVNITTLQFPEEMEYDDEYHKPEYKK